MTASDVIGIVLDTGAIHWSAISGTPSTTATITVALPSAAASGNYVYWFTSKAQRFPIIESAFLRYSSMTDTPMDIYTQVQQYDLGVSAKQSDGTPTCMLVEPLLRALAWSLSKEVAPAFSRQWTPEMEANRIEAVSIARGINAENSVLYFQSAA